MEEARAVIPGIDWKEETDKLLDIKQRWIRTGAVSKPHEDLEIQFRELLNDFFSRKKSFFEDRQRMYSTRVAAYQELIDQLKQISLADSFQARKEIELIKRAWRDLEPVSKSQYLPMKSSFDQLLQTKNKAIRDKQRDLQRNHQAVLQSNLESRLKILDHLRQAHEDYAHTSFKQLKGMLEEWKNAGSVNKEERKRLNDEFFELYDIISEKKFVLKLAKNKNENFEKLPSSDQLKIKVNILKELLRRDEREFETIKENAEKFSVASRGFDELINSKMLKTERKITIKRKILEQYKIQLAV
jgi:hypothetical protein